MDVVCICHGETEWGLTGRRAGRTDVALTANGRRFAIGLQPTLTRRSFTLVLSSPLHRARETCELAGLDGQVQVEPDLGEWDYGDFVGLTSDRIHQTDADWMIFRDGCPHGERPADMIRRVDRVIGRVRSIGGDVALFAHEYVLRVFAARWIGLPPEEGRRLLLGVGSVSVLSHYRQEPAIRSWNCSG